MSATMMADDLTGMGQNMSFEDLSAQGGQMTGGVANVPAGWNVYVNGKQVFTAADLQAAGITAWCGVNDDGEGAGMDGSYIFGLWNWSVPRFELSQTVSGLESGTYLIKAGLMVGANGGGSRRTTQRIFGNMSVRYFGSADQYDTNQIDPSEVYSFEGLEEPVTDRALQEMNLRVFVYDGTLTFGLRTDGNVAAALREGGNSSGGDGWFKTDNFRIEKVEFQPEDALVTYRHFTSQLEKFEGLTMQETISNEVEQLLSQELDANSSLDEFITAIEAAKACFPKAKTSVEAYSRLEESWAKSIDVSISYDAEFKSLGNAEIDAAAETLLDLMDKAEELLDAPKADADEINTLVLQLTEATNRLQVLCVPIETMLIDGVEVGAEYNFDEWGGYWYNQGGDALDKDVSNYDYVWIKFSNATGRIAFGIIYGEWLKTESWGESYYTDSRFIETTEGVIGIPLEKQKNCQQGLQGAVSPWKGDAYAKHIRQIFLQAQGGACTVKVEGIWYGTEEDYRKSLGDDVSDETKKKMMNLDMLASSWGGSEYSVLDHAIYIGEEWTGRGWWLATWNGERNQGTDYSAYDCFVVEFAEPTETEGELAVSYDYAEDTSTRFEAGTKAVAVDLSPEGKKAVEKANIMGPAAAAFWLSAAYFCTKDQLSEELTAVRGVTHNATHNAKYFNVAGQKVKDSFRGLIINADGRKIIRR